jgi:signal transduction histidine kinase
VWLDRRLAHPYSPARLLVIPLAVGFVLFPTSGVSPDAAAWAIGLGSAAFGIVGGRLPLLATFGQAALLVAAVNVASPVSVFVKVAGCVALFELTVRRPGWRVVTGAAAMAAGYAAIALLGPDTGVVAWLFRLVTLVGGPLLIGAYVRSLQHIAKQAEQSRALAARNARLEERTAIARELHDLVAHHVASMVLRVGVARHVLKRDDPRLDEVLDDVHGSASDALEDLRRLVAILRDPAALDPSVPVEPDELPKALEAVVRQTEQSGVTVTATFDAPAVQRLDALRRLVLLRLVQEGLANVVKHAGPTARAAVHVEVDDEGTARAEIVDTGGTPAERLPAGGHGLAGLAERISLAGGRLESGPYATGWRLAATLPTGGAAQ